MNWPRHWRGGSLRTFVLARLARIRSANPGHPSANHCATRYTFAPHHHRTLVMKKLLPASPNFSFFCIEKKNLLPSSYRFRASKQHKKTLKHDSIGSEKSFEAY
jgi:hypothetical protein